MPIEHLHTFLTHPDKGQINPRAVNGAVVRPESRVFSLMGDLYNSSPIDCKVAISFNVAANGDQVNDCRTLLLDYAANPSIESGTAIAQRLSRFTTNRSGLGLFFLAVGTEGASQRLILARFAANSGIVADEGGAELAVEFIERVFLRSIHSFKAVVYEDQMSPQAFWQGKAIDRQINNNESEVSRYWITDFLSSDFLTTPAAGTRTLARAMREAAKKSNSLRVKQEISAAALLGAGLQGQALTTHEFIDRFGLSVEARNAISDELPYPHLANQQFQFSAEEFTRQLSYKTVELDSGALMTAPTTNFDAIFVQTPVNLDGVVTFSATGKVAAEKLEKSVR